MKIKMLRTTIIEKLEEQLAGAEEYDAQKLAEHYARNASVAALRRAQITANLAKIVDNNKLAEADLWKLREALIDGVSGKSTCPMSRKKMIEQQLKMLRLDGRKTITLTDGDTVTTLMSPPSETSAALC